MGGSEGSIEPQFRGDVMSRRLENYSKEDAQERKRLIEKIDTHPS
jgi:hypothetical protein